jgi:hypothetical protein
MHDPMTIAFEIRYPWIRPHSDFRDPFITIWHIDPETDGSDDSCDWWGGRLTTAETAKIKKHAKDEYDFFFGYGAIGLSGADPLTIILACWRSAKWKLYQDRAFSHRELNNVLSLATLPCDNLRQYAQLAEGDLKQFTDLMFLVARQVKRLRRPWYKHPRFHVHHWKIQIHPIERLLKKVRQGHVHNRT